MEYSDFIKLVESGEQQHIDFKIICKAFLRDDGEVAKAELIKDICAMANNGNITSYILIGVSDDRETFCSVQNDQLTDTNLQELCKKNIAPPPKVKLFRKKWQKAQHQHKNKLFVIIQIGPNQKRAFYINKEYFPDKAKMFHRRHEVWVRRGATGDLAHPSEIATLEPLETKPPAAYRRRIPIKQQSIKKVNEEREFHRLVAAGMQFERARNFESAVECFEEALEIKSKDIGLLLELSVIYGEMLHDNKNKRTAIIYCKRILKIDKNNVRARFHLAIYTSHIKNAKTSLPLFDSVEGLVKNKEEWKNTELVGKLYDFKANELVKLNRISEGKEYYNKSISILNKLALEGDETAAFWLGNAKDNLTRIS